MKKLDSLTALRFFAATSIVIEHSGPSFRSMDWIPHLRYDLGVSFFFVLSGFILSFAYREFSSDRSVRDFYIARIARIWPLHMFTLAAFFALIPTSRWFLQGSEGHHLGILLANVFLVQAWIPKSAFFFSGNAVSWSISAETFFYMLFPALRQRWIQTWWPKLVLVLALALGVVALATWVGVKPFDPNHTMAVSTLGIGYISPLTQVLLFFIGMLAESVYQSLGKRNLHDGTTVWTALELTSIVLVIAVAHAVGGFKDRTALEIVVPYFSIAPFFAFLILVFATGRGVFARILSSRLLVLLGECSFALYMSHQILLMVLNDHRASLNMPDLALCLGYWSLSIATAFALWAFVETPARAWIRRATTIPVSSSRTGAGR